MTKVQFDPPEVDSSGQEQAAMSFPLPGQSGMAAAVQQAHEAALMAIDGVEGIGVALGPIGEEVLVVYVRDQSVAQRIPRKLDDVNVKIQVTGPVDALRR